MHRVIYKIMAIALIVATQANAGLWDMQKWRIHVLQKSSITVNRAALFTRWIRPNMDFTRLDSSLDIFDTTSWFHHDKYRLSSTPLVQALQGKRTDVARLLIHYGADVNRDNIRENLSIHRKYISNTPLNVAVETRNSDAVALLLKHGANPNKQTSDCLAKDTILMNAVRNKDACSVSALLDAGAYPQDEALALAVWPDDYESVSALLKAGARLQPGLLSRSRSVATMRALIQAGALVNEEFEGRTPLQKAVGESDDEYDARIQLLLENGARVVPGMLHKARSAYAVREFLKRGLDVNEKIDGEMPIEGVAARGNEQAVQALLDAGAAYDCSLFVHIFHRNSFKEYAIVPILAHIRKAGKERELLEVAFPWDKDPNKWISYATSLYSSSLCRVSRAYMLLRSKEMRDKAIDEYERTQQSTHKE